MADRARDLLRVAPDCARRGALAVRAVQVRDGPAALGGHGKGTAMSTEPPPPPPPGPPSAVPGDQPVSVGDAVSYGWSAYWKNIGPMLLIAVVVLVINAVFSGLSNAVDSNAAQILIQIAGTLVSLLVTLGWLRIALAITSGVRPQVGDLFNVPGFGSFIVASILFYIGAVIGFVLLIVPGIIFVATFGFYGFVIAERGEEVGIIESLERSAELTRGYRWRLFGLALVLLL